MGKKKFLYELLTSKERAIQIIRDAARDLLMAVILFIGVYKIIFNIIKVISPTFAIIHHHLILTLLTGELKIMLNEN